MARLEPMQLLEKLVRDLTERRDDYVGDLSRKLEKEPEKVTSKAVAGLNGRYRECSDILDMIRDGIKRI